MAADSRSATVEQSSDKGQVKPGRLPVSEILFSHAGAGSPFGDELTFPLPLDQIAYQHPEADGAPETTEQY